MVKTRKKSSKIDYLDMTPIEVYEYLLDKRLLKFPNNFVTKENMKEIIREVLLNRQKLTREEICDKVNRDYLKKYKLGGARRAFNNNIYELITYCFPEMKIEYWEMNKTENGFWLNAENRLKYIQWLVKKENIDVKSIDDLKKLTSRKITHNHGSKALKYSGGVYELVLMVAEVDVKEWQLVKTSVWTEEKAIKAVKWLIEERLKWTKEEVIENISVKIFYENDLGGLLTKYCDHSPLKALQIAYPGEYTSLKNIKPWQFVKK